MREAEQRGNLFGYYMRREIEDYSLRIGRRVTQKEISARAGMSGKHLSELLNGKTRTESETLARLVQAIELKDKTRINDLYQHAGLASPYPVFTLTDPETGKSVSADDLEDLVPKTQSEKEAYYAAKIMEHSQKMTFYIDKLLATRTSNGSKNLDIE